MDENSTPDGQPTDGEKHVEKTTEHTVERVETDYDNPGDHATTHPEDDDPQSLAGETQEDEN